MRASSTDPTLAAIATEIPRLRRYARYLTRSSDQADDLVQDCLERAIHKLGTWRRGTNLRAWLFTILRNGYISGIRSRKRASAVEIDGDAPELAAADGHEARAHLREVAHALGTLSAEHQHVLVLVAVNGLKYDEAAQVLALPVGTVRSRLSRARAALRARLEGGEADRSEPGRRPRPSLGRDHHAMAALRA